ncbi:olfactory receptor 8D1-like [Ambystoma mexicanum]|uniref:olfactory receptor 8D1-like n=1 Tax=Ambystoma mexicanum TaxID=8296 RepID=UPI0037E796B5
MERKNGTSVTQFILRGLSEDQVIQRLLFLFFLFVYLFTLVGNIGLIVLVRISRRLHTPMYFFLGNLSFVDVCYSSVIVPQMLFHFLTYPHIFSLHQCATQLFFFVVFSGVDNFLVAVMAYDRYVAICHPLMYVITMTNAVCIKMVIGAFLGGLISALIHTCVTFRLSFCASKFINHFYCDILPLLKISCSDTFINKIVIFIFGGFASLGSFLVIVVSYIYIISTIVKIHSTAGRLRAFSTCASHFTSVILFYGSIFFMYFKPSSGSSQEQDPVASVFYTVVIPMLNPVIYSFRNKEVKEALRNVANKKKAVTGYP